MITFIICLTLLVAAYFTYGTYLEKLADADDTQPTPALRLEDGVDYMKLPRWSVFLIQLLNIAGTGPIFVAMHDYLSGMLILQKERKSRFLTSFFILFLFCLFCDLLIFKRLIQSSILH